MRGSRLQHSQPYHYVRSIPASAGQPVLFKCFVCFIKVYPRECGAAFKVKLWTSLNRGLSPRVRGSLVECIYVSPP